MAAQQFLRRLLASLSVVFFAAAWGAAIAEEAARPASSAVFRAAIANLYASPWLDGPATDGVCDRAIAAAASRHGVPLRLMRAIALVESGRSVEAENGGRRRVAWPWTINVEGAGRFFDDKPSALSYVRARKAEGARSIDIGCMQVNHLWHGEAFPSLEAMFDPAQNADYAAQFLTSLKDETGDWMRAAGYYHSRTPVFEQAYRRKVDAAYETIAATLPSDLSDRKRSNRDATQRRRQAQPLITRHPRAQAPPTAGALTANSVGLGALTPTAFSDSAGLLRSAQPLFGSAPLPEDGSSQGVSPKQVE